MTPSVAKIITCGLDDRGLVIDRGKEYSLRQHVQIAVGPTSQLPNVYRVLSSGLKRPGHEANHSYPQSTEVKNEIFLPTWRRD
jgi:hypothetical protein